LEAIVNLHDWKIATGILANHFVRWVHLVSLANIAANLNLKSLTFLETVNAFLMPFLGISAALLRYGQ
jgi:hypothetical protein